MMIANMINVLYQAIVFILFVRIILSFLPQVDPNHPLVRFVHQVTEPLLAPFRQILPTGRLPVDFSPLLAFFVLGIIHRILIQLVAG